MSLSKRTENFYHNWLKGALTMQKFTLESVAELIAQVDAGTSGAHTLILDTGTLKLMRRFKNPPGDNCIATITHKEITEGLTDARWCYIQKKIDKINESNNAE